MYPQSVQLKPKEVVPAKKRTPYYAEILVQRISDTFLAPTLVLDEEGIVIASSNADITGVPFTLLEGKECNPLFRIPFCYEDNPGEVIVCELTNGEEISPRLAQVLVEMILDEITEWNRLPARSEVKNKFIYDLLHGNLESEATIRHYAEMLRLDLTPPRSVILIDAAGYILGETNEKNGASGQVQRRAQFIIDTVIRFFHLPDDLICAYLGEGQVVVLKASDSRNLADWAEMENPVEASSWADLSALKRATDALLDRLPSSGQEINIGLGRYHPGINGLAKSYTDAQMALTLGQRFNEERRIYCLDELGVAAFVGISHEQTKVELAEHLLSPLNDEPELLQTLDCFFVEDCTISVTASQLHIHRNTLSYRLDKIASLSGLDPRNFDDAIQIRLALLLRTLNGD